MFAVRQKSTDKYFSIVGSAVRNVITSGMRIHLEARSNIDNLEFEPREETRLSCSDRRLVLIQSHSTMSS